MGEGVHVGEKVEEEEEEEDEGYDGCSLSITCPARCLRLRHPKMMQKNVDFQSILRKCPMGERACSPQKTYNVHAYLVLCT